MNSDVLACYGEPVRAALEACVRPFMACAVSASPALLQLCFPKIDGFELEIFIAIFNGNLGLEWILDLRYEERNLQFP